MSNSEQSAVLAIGQSRVYAPLESVTLTGTPGVVSVCDGVGREYFRAESAGEVRVPIGGALGVHLALLEDAAGRIAANTTFTVDTRTEIEDAGGRYWRLLDILYRTMVSNDGEAQTVWIAHKFYSFFVCWLRDHVHTLKGMKYFYPELKSAIELYAEHQQADGMIWDNLYPRTPEMNYWDASFQYGGFIEAIEEGRYEFKRIPVENDVEYLFIEGIYYTWKATGDDVWMQGLLDNAIRAYEYTVNSPYRWSEQFQLLKRGFTIDTWDFQHEQDTALVGHAMVVKPGVTHFGVMHGDNTGYIIGCHLLAEMLVVAGRMEEAERYRARGVEMQARLDALAWNGEFYTHHVSEDPSYTRAVGDTPQDRQVSLSNAYDVNRGIDHEKVAAIIRTYQRIREEMPDTSPGEFFGIYPPFEQGFGAHDGMWEYVNGGVLSIVAGELAHGAFEHGFEAYGADILERVLAMGERHHGYLDCAYRGKMPQAPQRSFTSLDLTALANIDFAGGGAPGVTGWSGEGENDLHAIPAGRLECDGIPFAVIDPAQNGRRGCLCLSTLPGYAAQATLAVHKMAHSLYFLHTAQGNGLLGWMTLHYADGEHVTQYIHTGQQVGPWWMPEVRDTRLPKVKVAWRGANATFGNVGAYAYGFDNPRPEVAIREITFTAAETGNKWFILALTACDSPVFFTPSDVSFGIPDGWGAAAVVYALIEGLAGVKDAGRGFDTLTLAPRWSAAGVDDVTATVKYPASGGYARYRYVRTADRLSLRLATTAQTINGALLLPAGEVTGVTIDGQAVPVEITTVEDSRYLRLPMCGVRVHEVDVTIST